MAREVARDPKLPLGKPLPEVRPWGATIPCDVDGYLPRLAARETEPPWADAVATVVRATRSRFANRLVCTCLRGSVARGLAIEGTSDLDMVAVVTSPMSKADRGWIAVVREHVLNRFPAITDLDLVLLTRDDLSNAPWCHPWRFVLATQTIVVDGDDLIATLPRFRPDAEIAFQARALPQDLETATVGLDERDHQEIEGACRWIAKRLVRSGFELVMARENAYCRDLYPCAQRFARHYPARRDAMFEALVFAVRPSGEPDALRRLVDGLGPWLVGELERHGLKDSSPCDPSHEEIR